MSDSPGSHNILILVRSDAVGREIQEACRNAVSDPVNSYIATDLTQAVDIARDREPQAALVDLTGDLSNDRAHIAELRSAAPDMRIVGIYQVEGHASDFGSGYMVDLIRIGVSDFLRRPIAERELHGFFSRLSPEQTRPDQASLGTCIAFTSNKGGVGKTTLAVNVATALATRYPNEVLLIDASLQMGVCAPMLNLTPTTSLMDAFQQRQRLDSTLMRQLATPHDSGLLLMAAPPDPLLAADIDEQSITRVLNLARRTFRYVVVDTFPLFDQIVMSVLDIASRNYIVLDNVVPAVISAVHLLRLLENLQYPRERLRIVVNRYQRVAGNPRIDDISRSLGMNVDHVLPYDKRAITAANLGRPFAMDFIRWSALHRAFNELRDDVLAINS